MWYYYMKCLTERKKKQLKCWVIFKAFFFLLHILWYSCFTSIIDFQFIAGKKNLFLIPSMTTLIVRSLWHIFIANFTLFLTNPSSARSLQRLLFLEHNSTNIFTPSVVLPSFKVCIFTNPSAREGYDTRSIFKRSLTGLNSQFSFS